MSIERPIIKLQLSSTDLLVDRLAWAGLLFIWVFTLISYSRLPEIIPTHFDIKGHANGYGSKMTIWIVPAILAVIVAGISILNKYPDIFNYLKPITPDNAQKQYLLATRLLRYLKLAVVIIFGLITVSTVSTATTQKNGIGIWVLPVSLIFLFVPIIIYFYEANKKVN